MSMTDLTYGFEPDLDWLDHCPCLTDEIHRHLADSTTTKAPAPVWQTVVVAITLIIMFIFMSIDYIGPDWVMLTGLVVFMVCEIVTIKDGVAGFANEGILTVMALFVVAEGVGRTGALDYYLGKVLGTPTTIPGAQLRLMIPIAILSAFLNNTPIVAVMIPLTLRWAKRIGVPKQQLLMPLSYSTILGGTCTLVGTSTNLVVSGLLAKAYPDEAAGNIGLFDLAIYGVPNAIIGIAYMTAFASSILPLGNIVSGSQQDDLLLGARVKPWSPAAGRTIKRSGLGKSGGVFLVNVRRAATGNIHRAVSDDFVISSGDELYFTGSPEQFGEFCEDHGLEIINTENLLENGDSGAHGNGYHSGKPSKTAAGELENLRLVRQLSDQIEGRESVANPDSQTKVVVTKDETEQVILVGVDAQDRPGVLKDIAHALLEQGLNVKHSEAKVFGSRSVSVWRSEPLGASTPDLEEIWSVITNLLQTSDEAVAVIKKKSGTRVIRATVTKVSSLIGHRPSDIDFQADFSAIIVAYQKHGRNASLDAPLGASDLLILQTNEGSPLLTRPPDGFYEKIERTRIPFLDNIKGTVSDDGDIELDLGLKKVWTDLKVSFGDSGPSVPKGEFLTAFVVNHNSPLLDQSLTQLGYSKLPGVVLISVERPRGEYKSEVITEDDPLQVGDVFWYSGSAEAIAELQRIHGLVYYHEEQLKKASVELTERRLIQAVISRGSPLVGHTVRDARFRNEYGGAVIAIQRGSERVHEHPGNVKLQTGDVLLVEAGPEFAKKHGGNYRVFALVSEVEDSAPPRPRLFLLCVVLIVASLAIAAVELRSLLITASIVGIVMVSVGIVTQQEARDCLQWDLYITVASAFGIGTAMANSGVAQGIATFLVFCGKGLGIGDAGVYGAVYLAGNLLSAILTNNAAATLMFPIAMEAVDQTGADRLKMACILMLSASDYITSFGYQTNLMVYGPGEYANLDFFKLGAPMQVLLWLSTTAMVSTLSIYNAKWLIAWVICAAGLLVVSVIRLTGRNCIAKKDVAAKDVGVPEGTWQLAERGSFTSKEEEIHL